MADDLLGLVLETKRPRSANRVFAFEQIQSRESWQFRVNLAPMTVPRLVAAVLRLCCVRLVRVAGNMRGLRAQTALLSATHVVIEGCCRHACVTAVERPGRDAQHDS